MKPILPGIWQWSWYSEEKQIDFNGLFLAVGEHRILVDPPPMSEQDKWHCRRGEPVDYIVLTNRDHTRETVALQREFECKLYVPDADAGEMELQADKTYQDGEYYQGVFGPFICTIKSLLENPRCFYSKERGS